MAVAALPVVVGLSGDKYADAAKLPPAYQTALLVCAGAIAAGAALAVVALPGTHEGPGEAAE